MTDYRLIRSKRRTLSIAIDGEGALVVHAPMRMPLKEIEDFIHQKQRWIEEKQALMQGNAARRKDAQLTEGGRVPFCGNVLIVHFEPVRAALDSDGRLILPAGGNAVKSALKWRRRRAEELLKPRVEKWAERTGLKPSRLSFGNAQKRWGSMNSRGEMRLNTALVHLPPEMADYVIVHELAHMSHPDHSPAFHALVRSILPQADGIRQAMKAWSYVTSMWRDHSSEE